MTRESSSPLANLDLNIKQTLYRRLRQANLRDIGSTEVSVKVDQEIPMAKNQRSILDYARPFNIIHSAITANNFQGCSLPSIRQLESENLYDT